MSLLFLAAAAFASEPASLPVKLASLAGGQSESRAEESGEDPVQQNITTYYDRMYAQDFRKALEAAQRLDPDPGDRTGTAMVAAMRASALLGLKKDKEAQRLIEQADKLAPHEPDILSTLFLGSMLADRVDVAADALDRMIARAPDKVRELDKDLVYHLLREQPEVRKEQNDNRRVALAQLGFGGSAGDWLTSDAIGILLKRGDPQRAVELLPYLNDPDLIEEMLMTRRFAALWTQLESIGGPHLEKVRGAALSEAQREYDAEPGDAEKLSSLITALHDSGELGGALELRSKIPSNRETMSKANMDMGWAIDAMADVLIEADRADDADQLYALLNDSPMEGGGRWRVSMKINRLGQLVSDEKFDRALLLLDPTELSARDDGNDYARQLVRRLKYCTLSRLNRQEAAKALRPELMKHAKDAPGPTIDALLCAGEVDEAEKLALSSVADDKFHHGFISRLQTQWRYDNDPSLWKILWRQLRQRPDVAREFERLGRDLPEHLQPKPLAEPKQVSASK